MNKGQIELSFGMIFSIIIIIATVAIAFFVITHFMTLGKCSQIGTFYNAIEKDIGELWVGSGQKLFQGALPSGVKEVCFGNLSTGSRTYETERSYLEERTHPSKNLFIYPFDDACDAALASFKLEHVVVSEFFCVPVNGGKFSVRLSKGNFESLVRLSKP